MAWSGITEDYTVGWADVTDYFLTNNISGAWIGSWFVNQERWAELPDHLKSVVMAAIEAGHTYRNQWYWGGEAALRANGDKLALRQVPASEWAEVENAAEGVLGRGCAGRRDAGEDHRHLPRVQHRHQPGRCALQRSIDRAIGTASTGAVFFEEDGDVLQASGRSGTPRQDPNEPRRPARPMPRQARSTPFLSAWSTCRAA